MNIAGPHADSGDDDGDASAALIEDWLTREAASSAMTYYEMRNARFSLELRDMERAHPQKRTSFKMAWLYCNGREQTLPEVFAHQDAPPAFFTLMEGLAERISLKGWKRYRGDFGNDVEQDSYYVEWRGIEIMFHLAQWLNSEQHRRLIGNDVVVAVYYDGPGPFNPVALNQLGTVPQIFAVVSPHAEQLYRLDMFSRPNIKAYAPHLAIDQLFTLPQLKDFLFTKCTRLSLCSTPSGVTRSCSIAP